MYEFMAAEGVRVHPNGVSLVLPQTLAETGTRTNGTAASEESCVGKTSLLTDSFGTSMHSILSHAREHAEVVESSRKRA